MNTPWLKPLITFAIGIILGVGGMYLVGIRPAKILTSQDISGIPGLANAVSLISNNKMLVRADLFVTLQGIISEIKGNTITLINGDAKPITLILNETTPVFEQPVQSGANLEPPKEIKFQDLKVNDVIDVFGQLSGSQVLVQSAYREVPPSPSQ